jgi:hypothetical protein
MILFHPKLKIYQVMYHSALKSIVLTFRIELSEAQRAEALLVYETIRTKMNKIDRWKPDER